ncbi:bile acid:sodium symporter family protein [Sphingomonas nostoxanthinifaciens]|uniref:bile acid:sodium symporter family protein n=1 Tax=Sphingomonas nostoxanthinifaciens TaxID=2872652 RepID=UPI001CC1CC8C|nr:bile acid:sodium symporter [Sphingomonas nostoxanthinifaciens]UAK25134.1 bile acid:sodium symporter [Sphingomonas nostoxanthinifaciens]
MIDAAMAIAGGTLLPIALWLIMFAMGTGLVAADFRHIVTNSRSFLLGVGSMLLLVPAAGILYAVLLAPGPALTMGLILLATCPGGILSNLLTDLARGNVALSVSMSLFVSVIYVFTLPFIAAFGLTFVYGAAHVVPVPILDSLSRIMMVTVVPVATGMIVRAVLPRLALRFGPPVKTLATTVLVIVFLMIVVQQWATLTRSLGVVLTVVVLMNVTNVGLALLVSRLGGLPRGDRVAITMEHIVRQEATAIFVAVTLLHHEDMSLPMIVNTFVGMAVGVPLVAWLRARFGSAEPATAS